jgi:hypothetical protein
VTLAALLITGCVAFGADTGYIRARGSPADAGLFVDGKYLGPASRFTVPEKYAVSAGEHEVTLQDPRREKFTAKVTVQPNKTSKIHYKMKKKEPPKGPFGRIRLGGGEPESFISVATGDSGPIYINGDFVGYIDELNNLGTGIQLPAGAYEVKIESQVYGEVTKTVELKANQVVVIPMGKK